MRIVNRQTFLNMPEGTVYGKGYTNKTDDNNFVYINMEFDGVLTIKRETTSQPGEVAPDSAGDWAAHNPCDIDCGTGSTERQERLNEMWHKGTSYPMNLYGQRDALWEGDDSTCFLIFERDDLLNLRGMIDIAIELAS